MKALPKLIFPKPSLKLRDEGDSYAVLDKYRRRWLKLTPEEWVRRHVLSWLESRGHSPLQIIQEYPIDLNGQPQRADIVVVDNSAKPLMLIECKAPQVAIDSSTLEQAVRYNSRLGAERVILTNGLSLKAYHYDGSHYTLIHRQG